MREGDQARARLEQTFSDSDQSSADTDQTASDADEAASQSDERGAQSEQRASDRDQASADREKDSGPESAAARHAYDESTSQREEASAGRKATSASRTKSAKLRARQPALRDETAATRDATAFARDRVSASRDRDAAKLDDEMRSSDTPIDARVSAHLDAAEAVRRRAAGDRAAAAIDRERAAKDRGQAAAARQESLIELQRAHLDSLTGIYLRELGFMTLEHEIDRARRAGEHFSLAFVGVDGLKSLNDRLGRAAGDALLRAVAQVLRSNLRSYDPVVRVGGDEFICGFSGTDLDAARHRLDAICLAVEASYTGGSVSVGVAELSAGDDMEELIARADEDMHARRKIEREGEAASE